MVSGDDPDFASRLRGPLPGDDPRVLALLKEEYLDPPSSEPYALSTDYAYNKEKNGFNWPWIRERLGTFFEDEPPGFFVEAGALDGEYLSNSLWLEKDLGWSGLLVEPDEDSYKALKLKKRKAWTSNTCLSTGEYPKQTVFVSNRAYENNQLRWWTIRGVSHIKDLKLAVPSLALERSQESYKMIQCFPLASYLLALGVTQVDLLSLDVQGAETEVLTSLDHFNVTFRVIVAEYESEHFRHSFVRMMNDRDYVLTDADADYVFVKKGDPLLRKLKSRPMQERLDAGIPITL